MVNYLLKNYLARIIKKIRIRGRIRKVKIKRNFTKKIRGRTKKIIKNKRRKTQTKTRNGKYEKTKNFR